MKAVILSLIAGLSVVAGSETVPEWQTPGGIIYRNATVVAVRPDGVSLQFEDGVVRIDYDNLSPEQRETYHLTAEGRDAYQAQQREKERLAREAAKQREAETPSEPRKIPGSYVSVDDIKRLWLSRVVMPNPLQRDSGSVLNTLKGYVNAIRNGSRDRDAEKAAATQNKAEAVRVGDFDRAALEEQTLARISQAESDDASRAQVAEYQRKKLEALQAASQPVSTDSGVVYESDPGYTGPAYTDLGSSQPSAPPRPPEPPCPPSPPSPPSQPPAAQPMPSPVGR